ncbi:LacI family DNA-binding transcriptional regulator [Yoonia sp. 2307UL14-13]|uniref:LacI family DNA-binding transcriptional regulator n=1 Tax=Yoonia sp. 2307UL14-13 TaxID=3126506 RepID=UPI0030B323A5
MNLKELSQNLGLSQTTVSRALNGYPEVSAKTRQRVEQAAAKFNYRPSNRAKGLATGKSYAIGHVIPLSTKHEMVNPIFGDFIAGAGETYAREGYEMTLSIVDDQDEAQIYSGLKSKNSVDGVVVHGPRMNDNRITLLQELGLPFVVHGRVSGCETPYPWLDVNNRSAFRQLTKYLIGLGHRRIALINGLEVMDFAHRRRAGYEAALIDAGLSPDPTIMRSDEMTEEFGYETTRDVLQHPDPPTGIVCSSLISAIGVRRGIEDAGLKMGQDVSVVTHDDALSYLKNGGKTPIFTATRSSVRDAGRHLAQMLLQAIADPDQLPQTTLWDAEFVIGGSTGPAPSKD